MDSLIVQLPGCGGQIFLGNLHHHLIDLHQINALHLRIPHQFPDHAAVPGSDDQDPLRVGMNSHRNVGDHLMIDKFILLRQHHIAVQGQKPAEFRRFKHINPLVITVPAVELTVHPDRKFHVLCLFLRKPKLHLTLLSAPEGSGFPYPPVRSGCTPFPLHIKCTPRSYP